MMDAARGRHDTLECGAEPCYGVVDPVHRILSYYKCSPEYQEHYGEENREADEFVCRQNVENLCEAVPFARPRSVCLGECACHETVFFGSDNR